MTHPNRQPPPRIPRSQDGPVAAPPPRDPTRIWLDPTRTERAQAVRADAASTAAQLLGDCSGTAAGIAARLVELAQPIAAWENYPEIGEDDWEHVLADVRHLAERTDVQTEHYESAYRHLANRATETEEGPTDA